MSFTIGCDPELICRRNGQFVPAHNFFKSHSSFGLDGCESTAERRRVSLQFALSVNN